MKTYSVSVPITGKAFIEIEADSEEQAISKAIEQINMDHIEEWEAHEQIIKGNVFYGMMNEAEATEIEP